MRNLIEDDVNEAERNFQGLGYSQYCQMLQRNQAGRETEMSFFQHVYNFNV